MQGKNPPRNCNMAFSKEGDQIYNNRSYTADQTRANRLSGDVEEEIRLGAFMISHSKSIGINMELVPPLQLPLFWEGFLQ